MQRWRSGESARLPPMCPGFDSRARRHMWVEFVVVLYSAPRGFSPCTPVFPSPPKTKISNSPLQPFFWDVGERCVKSQKTAVKENLNARAFLNEFLNSLVLRG